MAVVDFPQKVVGYEIRKKLGDPDTPDPFNVFGIYRTWTRWGKTQVLKEKFYRPFNPRTELQQSNRLKFADAVAAWQSLTFDEKKYYNKKSAGSGISGYNYFIKLYMLG